MGSVFSIVFFPSLFVESVLKLGVAVAAAGAFYPFNEHYLSGLLAILPFCEPVESEPFEDFRAVLEDLRNEHLDKGLDIAPRPLRRLASRTRLQREQSSVWRSRTVEAKQLHKAAAVQARVKAHQFSRRYRLYGPPDWTDPALSLLPSLCLAHNVQISPFPFAAPHIVLTPPPHDSTDYFVARANCIPQQDQAFGDRLVVAEPPSCSGPDPVIINSAPARPGSWADERVDGRDSDGDVSDVPSLLEDTDDASSVASSECGDPPALPSASHQEESSRYDVQPRKPPVLWVEEEEEGLPDLPASWLS